MAGLRTRGASAAAKVGAVGMLIRSLSTASLRTPHTGAMSYEEGVPQVPAAAVSAEDAELLHRLLAGGPVKVELKLGCQSLPDGNSFNVVAEVKGREKPREVVLQDAHAPGGTRALALILALLRQPPGRPRLGARLRGGGRGRLLHRGGGRGGRGGRLLLAGEAHAGHEQEDQQQGQPGGVDRAFIMSATIRNPKADPQHERRRRQRAARSPDGLVGLPVAPGAADVEGKPG